MWSYGTVHNVASFWINDGQLKPEALKSLYRSPGYKKPIGPM